MPKYSYSLDIGKDLQKPKSGEELGAKEIKDQFKDRKNIQIKHLDGEKAGERSDLNVDNLLDEQQNQSISFTDSEQDVFDILSEIKREKKENKLEDFFTKYAPVLFLVVLLIFGFYNLSKTDKLRFVEEISDADVNTQLLSSITKKIFIEWPLLGVVEKQKKIQETFQSFINDPAVKEKKVLFADMLKEQYKNTAGQVFLYTDESYSILLNAEKASQGESRGDFLAYTVYYFSLLMAKIPSINADLFKTAFYTPAVFGVLIAAILFFFTQKVMNNPRAGFFAAFLLLINHSFFTKTYAGNLNSALLHLLFVLVLNLLFLYVVSSPLSVKVLSVFAGIPIFLLYMSISNYMWKLWAAGILFYFVALFVMFMFRIREKEDENSFYNSAYLFVGVFTLLFSMVFVLESSSLIFNYNPDFFAGKILSVLSIIGVSYLVVRNLKLMDSKEIFVISWFISLLFMTYASKSALYLLSLPASIVAGVMIEKIYTYLFSFVESLSTGLSNASVHFSLLVFLPLFFLFANGDNINITKTVYPIATTAHSSIGEFIQYELPENLELLVYDKNFMWQYFTKKNAARDKKQELTNILLSDFNDAHEKLKCSNCSFAIVLDEDALYALLNENNAENDKFLLSKIKKCGEESEKVLRCGKNAVSLLNNSVKGEVETDLLLIANGTSVQKVVSGAEQTLVLYDNGKGNYYSFVINQNARDTALVRMMAGEELPGFKLRKQTYEPVRVVLYESYVGD